MQVEERKEGQGLAGKVMLTVLLVIAVMLLVVYFAFSIYFMKHFFFRATLNGRDVSCYSVDQMKEVMQEELDNYQLKILERNDKVEQIAGRDIGLNINWDESIPLIVNKQNGFKWLWKLIFPENLVCDKAVSYDEEKVVSKILGLSCMNKSTQIEPVDAMISDYDTENGFTILAPVDGTVIDEEILVSQVKQALTELRESCSIEEVGAYVEASIQEDNEYLVKTVNKLNEFAGSKINYKVGEDVWTLDATTFIDWLDFDTSGEIVLDEEKVAEYVRELSRKYSTCYADKEFKTSYGKKVTISNCQYGWKVDEEAEKQTIIEEIKAGKSVDRDLNYSMTANSHGKYDYGKSYVEINLTTQHLFLYEDGKLVLDTDFVSGNESRGNGTPTGVFGVTYTQRDATLNGQGYSTPVSFWMPFNGNVGMHDATWRAKFGGTIYKTSGSHGCVNLPYSAAEKIFSVVSKNYPVLVYRLDVQGQTPAQTTQQVVSTTDRQEQQPKVEETKKQEPKKKQATKKKTEEKKETQKKKDIQKKENTKKKDTQKKDTQKTDTQKKKDTQKEDTQKKDTLKKEETQEKDTGKKEDTQKTDTQSKEEISDEVSQEDDAE